MTEPSGATLQDALSTKTPSQKTLLIIDGHSLAFRAFYALPPEGFRLDSGVYTNAVHGFLGMLLSLIAQEHPTHLAVAFDLHKSFRNDEYTEYKGTRSEPPEEFHGQVEHLQEVLSAMNVHWLTAEGYEADDILATLSRRGGEADFSTLVVSGDRDTFQLISDHTTLLYPIRGVSKLIRYDDAAVLEKYGVHAQQYPELAALVGETSDNLPGVPGVGPKTAAKWITKYGSLDALLERSTEIKGKVGDSLRDHVDDVKRNRHLNRLLTDVPVDDDWDTFAITHINDAEVDRVFDQLQLKTMKARVKALGDGFRGGSTPSVAEITDPTTPGPQAETTDGIVQDPAPEVRIVDGSSAAMWANAHTDKPIGVAFTWADSGVSDLAGDDSSRENSAGESSPTVPELASIALATHDEIIVVDDNEALSAEHPVIKWLSTDAPKIFFDAKAVLKRAWAAGFSIEGIAGDALLSWYLDDPSRGKYTLDRAAERYFVAELPTTDPSALFDDHAQQALGISAWMTVHLDSVLAATPVREILERIELPLVPVLARMEYLGIAVDANLLDQLYDTFGDRAKGFASEAIKIVGHEVNLSSPKQLQTVLFDELNMPTNGIRKTKTGYSTNADTLTTLYEQTEAPFLAYLLEYRDWTKLAQIVETLRKSIAADARIHTTYLQTGAATGRLSSTDPNLQNIPVRSEAGAQIREVFTASAGRELMTADYSQIEMRIMAHLSQDPGLIAAFKSGEDLHRYVGGQVFGVDPQDVTPAMRSKVKAMSYGLVYGLSAFGLARQLRIPQIEARDLMNGYFQRFGGVRDYLRDVVARAEETGYTETIFGRRRYFPDLTSRNRVARQNAQRAALNAPIQGSAADIMKLAMITIDREFRERNLMSSMLLQVHDEVIVDVVPDEHDEVQAIVADAMDHAITLDVPLDIHIGFGGNWGTAAHD